MKTTELLLQYSACDSATSDTSVIIVAAGSSSRMGGVSKQLLSLGGIPVIARTMMAFENCDAVKNIVLVARECDILEYQNIARKYMITKLSDIVEGGASREESVKKGMSCLDNSTEIVLIHDGARPLVSKDVIESVIIAARTHGASMCAVPVKDTIKVVKDGFIADTLDRSSLYSAQTPQGFKFSLFKECIESAEDLSLFSDDCSLVEKFNIPVNIVMGDYKNIKITTLEDVLIAESFIKRGEE